MMSNFYIAETNALVIFGLHLCLKLGLVDTQCKSSIMFTKLFKEEHPDRFSGLGQLSGKYSLYVREDATPER